MYLQSYAQQVSAVNPTVKREQNNLESHIKGKGNELAHLVDTDFPSSSILI